MKVSYQSLRAALALVDPELSWWEGTIKAAIDQSWYVVAQCKSEVQAKVVLCLGSYGLQYSYREGRLFIISTDNIELDLPPKVIPEYGEDDAHGSFKRSVLEQMHELGVARLFFEYSGSGDSGNPDHIIAYRSHSGYWGGTNVGITDVVELPQAFQDELSEYVWDKLVQWDVVNNDGGGGHLNVTTSGPEPVFEFECHTYETISTTQENCEL